MKTKKILVLYTGGTFGMSENLEIPDLSAPELKSRLLALVPEMKRIAECEVRVLFNMDSCQMGLSEWLAMAEVLKTEAKRFDGAVILHGTDTLPYSAAALSYLLAPSPMPIVLTGAQKPLSALRNDARTNLLTALEVAAQPKAPLKNRVMVAFHDELYLGSRIRKLSAIRFAAFESPRFPPLAKVGSLIQYSDAVLHLPKLPKASTLLKMLLPRVKRGAPLPRILKLEVTPEFPGEVLGPEALSHLDGILLTLYTSGTAPTLHPSFLKFLKAANAAHLPVYAITEREEAPPSLGSYEAGRSLQKHGLIWSHEMTPEAALVKAQLLHLRERVGHGLSRSAYLRWVRKNWARPLTDELEG